VGKRINPGTDVDRPSARVDSMTSTVLPLGSGLRGPGNKGLRAAPDGDEDLAGADWPSGGHCEDANAADDSGVPGPRALTPSAAAGTNYPPKHGQLDAPGRRGRGAA